MEVYLFIILLLIIFSYLDLNFKQNRKWVFLVIIFILLVLQDGLRWETGTDWTNYKNFFEKDPGWLFFGGFGLGYTFLNDVVYSVSQNYSSFLIVHAIIIYSLYLKSINDYTEFPLITALCFYCTFIGYMGMNRQHIALAICLFVFRYIASREILKFSFWVIIASLFHGTAVLFFIAYFLNRRIPRYVYVTTFVLSFILNPIITSLFKHIIPALPFQFEILDKLGAVAGVWKPDMPPGEEEMGNPILIVMLGIIKRVLIFCLLYSNLAKLKTKVPNIELMLNIYFVSILFYVTFNNSIQILVGRGNLYLGSLFEVFLLPYLIYVFKKSNGALVVLLIVVLMVTNAFRSITVDIFTPYKGIYYNSEYFRVMH